MWYISSNIWQAYRGSKDLSGEVLVVYSDNKGLIHIDIECIGMFAWIEKMGYYKLLVVYLPLIDMINEDDDVRIYISRHMEQFDYGI